jgi:hypothetical protein
LLNDITFRKVINLEYNIKIDSNISNIYITITMCPSKERDTNDVPAYTVKDVDGLFKLLNKRHPVFLTDAEKEDLYARKEAQYNNEQRRRWSDKIHKRISRGYYRSGDPSEIRYDCWEIEYQIDAPIFRQRMIVLFRRERRNHFLSLRSPTSHHSNVPNPNKIVRKTQDTRKRKIMSYKASSDRETLTKEKDRRKREKKKTKLHRARRCC